MNTSKEFKKCPTLIYTIIVSLLWAVPIFVLSFIVFPELIKIISQTSPSQAEKIKNYPLQLVFGYFILISLANLYFWKMENKLRREEKEVQKILDISPQDPLSKEKLRQIEKKRQFYASILGFLVRLVLGLTIGFLAYSFIRPLYQLLGEF